MEAEQVPDIIGDIEGAERAFMEELRDDAPEPEETASLSEVDAYLDYLLEKIRDRKKELERHEETAERRIKMITDWLEGERARIGRQIEWLEKRVRRNVPGTVDRMQERYGTSKKSISLPHGQVGFRSSRPTVEVEDEEKALQWAEESCPDAIKVKRSVLKTPVKAMLNEEGAFPTGEAPDPETNGLRFVPGSDSFYVRTED